MKQGLTLQEMAKELERQQNTKRDFIAPAKELQFNAEDLSMKVNGHGNFKIQETAHQQIAQRLGIPQKYYDRMLSTDHHELLAENVNSWIKEEKEPKMIRTLDGGMRAFLSHRYRPLDNFDLADSVLPVLLKLPGIKVESCALTEKRLYIKAVTEEIKAEVKKGDMVQAGIVISNSEIGLGSVKIEPMIFRLVCLNGMISPDHSLRKYHVGRNTDAGGDLAAEFYRDETRQTDDKAFWMKVQDVVGGAFNEVIFAKIVEHMKLATQNPIEGDPVKVVEIVQKKYGMSDFERSGILTHLIQGADLTQYGIVNAITRTSQDVKDYDRATDLERMGGEVLELPKQEWSEISKAA